MIDKSTAVRALRDRISVVKSGVAAQTPLPNRVSGAMTLKMLYQQVHREEYARRLEAVEKSLDKLEEASE